MEEVAVIELNDISNAVVNKYEKSHADIIVEFLKKILLQIGHYLLSRINDNFWALKLGYPFYLRIIFEHNLR